MTIETVSLQEYGSVDVRLGLDAALELRRAGRTALGVAPQDEVGSWQLRAGSVVGTIVTPSIRVLIRPKVSGANLFHMLEADGIAIAPGREVFEYERTGDLVPAFATFFVRHLEGAIGRGLRRQYLATTELVAGVRGRVNFREQLRAGGLPLPVACDFDEHTLDTQLNRLLLGATVRLVRLPGVAQDTRRALLQIVTLFEDAVGAARPSDLHRPTAFTRLDDHFRASEHLARLVLSGSSITDAYGSAGASTFAVDMNVIFERFVEARLRRNLRDRMQVLGQSWATLDVDGSVRMRPDLVFRRHGVPVYVGDAKYKLTADGFGRETDYYQLLAYCTALDLREGLLIYCQHDGSTPRQDVTVVGSSSQHLRTVAVRLDGAPSEVDLELRRVAEDVWLQVLVAGEAPVTRK